MGTVKKATAKNKKKVKSKIPRKSVVHIVTSTGKTKKCKRKPSYSQETLQNALQAIHTGISLRKISRAYGVPVATLYRRNKHPDVAPRGGPPTVLTPAEEEEIVQWILYRSQRGFPVSKTELLDCVQKFVIKSKKKTPFINDRPSRHWYEAFRKRHTNLTIRKPQHLSLTRASVSEEDLKEWFFEQETYLKSKNLLDIEAERVFNCDETNIQLCPDSEKVLTEKGCRSAYKITDAGKENLTVLFTYSAKGVRAPPMLMFAYKQSLPRKIVENTPKGWGIGVSESGWMTSETFFEYITNIFYPWLLKEKVQFSVILWLDNHSSHANLPLVSFCREKKIELIGLYPNATHIIQPLDIAYFHPFKEMWRKTVQKWKVQKDVLQLKKENFPRVLQMTLDDFKNEQKIIQNGFKASGLLPFNFDAINCDVLNKKRKIKEKEIDTLNYSKHLQDFEKNIPPELLEEFKVAKLNQSWTGMIEQKALYEYWLRIKTTDSDVNLVVNKPTVKSIENFTGNVRIVSLDDNVIRCEKSVLEIDSSVTHFGIDTVVEQSVDLLATIDTIDIKNPTIEELQQVEFILNIDADQIDEPEINLIQNCDKKNEDTDTLRHVDKDMYVNENVEKAVANEENKENSKPRMNEDTSSTSSIALREVLTMPIKYLPKKKRAKVEVSGKPKRISAATSDLWLNDELEKEAKLRLKEEKLAKKKKLQEEKKQLAEEKKKLQEKMKEIQNKIKQEK